MSTAVVVGDTEAPLVAQLAAAPSEVGVFGSSRASTVAVAVLYGNNRNETQRGLSLKLPEPGGARIQTAARETEEEPIAGERVWDLPDLAPGAIARFEFTLQFLSATASNAPLVVEIDGEGFDGPVRSEPVILNVLP